MTRRDLKLIFAHILCCVAFLGLMWAFSPIEAQESAELSETGYAIPDGEVKDEVDELYGIWEIGGELRQAIIDTVKAVLARELRGLTNPRGFSKWDLNRLICEEWESVDEIIDSAWVDPVADTVYHLGCDILEAMIKSDPIPALSPEVQFTNGIPICPYCRVGTKRIEHSPLMDSNISLDLLYELPRYDENGELYPKRKPNYWGEWECLECGKHYTVEGNSVDGWRYGN